MSFFRTAIIVVSSCGIVSSFSPGRDLKLVMELYEVLLVTLFWIVACKYDIMVNYLVLLKDLCDM